MRTTTPLLMTVALLTTTGCMSSATDMRGFDNCSQLSRYMKTAEFRGSLDNAFNAVNVDFSSVLIAGLDENGSPVEVTPNEDPWSGATTFTGTNIQHDGVQESDLVKTDGAVIYAISGGKLVVSQAWPAEDAKQLAVLDVDGSAVGLYHYDGTVVVVSVLNAGEAPAPRSGVDPFGGFGRVAPVVLALVILQIISSGLNLLGANQHLATALWGGFLIAVMVARWLLWYLRGRRRST